MAIDPSISLAVKPVQIEDPLATTGKALAIKGAMQNQAIGAQQLQSGALGLQQQQQQMADQQTLRQVMLANKGDMPATLKDLVGKVSPATYNATAEGYVKLQEEYGKLDEQKQKALDYKLNKTADFLAPVLNAPPEQKPLVYQQAIGALKASGIDTSGMKPEYTNDEDIQASLAHANGYLKMAEDVRKEAEAKRQAAEEARKAELHPTVMAKTAAEATAAEQKATGTEPIQPPQAATLAQTAAHNKAMEANAEELRKQGEQRIGIERQHASIAQHVYDQTYGEGANPALVGVEPKLRTQAMTQAQKAAADFTKAMESSKNVQTFIDLARSGNKAAGSNLPIMGAESIQALNGIRRINRTEIEQYQGAGSLLDRINGRVGKLVSGQPIPKDVMDDIEKLHQTIMGNATEAYNTTLNGINQNYRSNFQPVKGAATAKGGGVPEVTSQADYEKLPKGAKYTFNGEPHVKQ